MAESNENVMFDSTLIENREIVAVSSTGTSQNSIMADDILQQAFEEATEGLNDSGVQYTRDNVLSVADNTVSELSESDGSVFTTVGPDGKTYRFVTSGDGSQLTNEQLSEAIQQVISAGPQSKEDQAESMLVLPTEEIDAVTLTEEGVEQLNAEDTVIQEGIEDTETIQVHMDSLPETAVSEENQSCVMSTIDSSVQPTNNSSPNTVTAIASVSGNPPLGSSKNPIRIVQQGNQYTSLQHLTPEQLSQIMQVVQQQQLLQKTQHSGGASVLYNPQTQTRIVYRVLYPSELHGKANSSDKTNSSAIKVRVLTDSVTIPEHRRQYRKRRCPEDDEEQIDAPTLSKEEKEQRKKAKPRTRSGRVSKPPKHMMQDYKHIHLVDWDDDYDSDGGYSDYKVSSDGSENDEDDKENGNVDSETLLGKYLIAFKRYLCN